MNIINEYELRDLKQDRYDCDRREVLDAEAPRHCKGCEQLEFDGEFVICYLFEDVPPEPRMCPLFREGRPLLTEKQFDYLETIIAFFELDGFWPSYRDLADDYDVNIKVVNEVLKAIEKKGYIKLHGTRSIEIVGYKTILEKC